MQSNELRILRASRSKWARVCLICVVAVVIGILMIDDGQKTGWLCVLSFGLGCVVALVSMLPNAAYLQLTPQDFTMCSMFRAHTFRWQDVTGFGVGRLARSKMVMFNYSASYQKSPGLRSFNARLVGYEAGLPDTYGLSHDALAALLNQYKASSL